MEMLLYLVPVFGILGLLFAAYLAARVGRQDAGNDRMKEIAAAISDGAQAFLTAEYKILIIFVAVLFILIGVGIGNWITAVCFVVGALFSTLAGYCGMKVATKANVRTANAAKEKGMNKALSIAFSGGAVMGMCVAGFGVFGVSIIYILTKNVDIITGFSLGASSIALFARVGGGIYTKAADVGADLVGKVEAGIPEDEPYDLQKKNQWTWDKFEEYCKKLTKDTDGDGKTDQYAMASFSKYYLPMCAANNNATFVSRDKDGKYVDAITSKEFKDAMNWGVDLIKKGYIKPKPSENVAWDWYKAAFRDGEAAMQTAEVYEISAFADMEDDWGFVMFPYNQDQKDATNKTVPNDNIVVMPSCFDQEKAEKIAFAYDLYTEPVEGYTPHDQILEQYYPQFRDDRAVDETIGMMLEEKHKSTSYLPMISEIDYGDFCYPVYANATTPAKKIEELSTKWDTKISKVNAEYDKFAKEHTK